MGNCDQQQQGRGSPKHGVKISKDGDFSNVRNELLDF